MRKKINIFVQKVNFKRKIQGKPLILSSDYKMLLEVIDDSLSPENITEDGYLCYSDMMTKYRKLKEIKGLIQKNIS